MDDYYTHSISITLTERYPHGKQAERWGDDRARYAAIECAKAIEAQAPT